jgi:hypothetical protein
MHDKQCVIIRFLANQNWNANEITVALKEDCGQDGYVLRTVQSWLVEIRQGRQGLHDLQRSSRPPLDHIGIQILGTLDK